MSALHIAIIATRGFSPFHFSVPSIVLFGKAMPEPGLFHVDICAEQLGLVESDMGMSINVKHGLERLNSTDIIIVPFWEYPEMEPTPELLESLRQA